VTAQTPQLRPLGVGEILDVAIKIYFRHARTLLAIVLLIVAPAQALIGLIDVSLTEGTVAGVEEEPVSVEEDLSAFVGGFALIGLISILSTSLATAACYKAVVDAYLGEQPSARDSLAFVGRRLHSVIWILFLTYVLAGLALLALIIPGVWLYISWTVALPVLLTEDVCGSKALGRSFRLVRGRWWATFGIVLLGTILAGVVSAIVGGIVGAIAFSAESDVAIFLVNAVAGTLGAVIATPFTAAFVTVLYVDLRVRKEAFDLQLLAERLGRPPAPEPAGA
jgi:hypothetical protein